MIPIAMDESPAQSTFPANPLGTLVLVGRTAAETDPAGPESGATLHADAWQVWLDPWDWTWRWQTTQRRIQLVEGAGLADCQRILGERPCSAIAIRYERCRAEVVIELALKTAARFPRSLVMLYGQGTREVVEYCLTPEVTFGIESPREIQGALSLALRHFARWPTRSPTIMEQIKARLPWSMLNSAEPGPPGTCKAAGHPEPGDQAV